MTGSPNTNKQRRPQCSPQMLVSFGLDVEFTGSFGKHLVDGVGGRCREGGGGTRLSPEPHRPAHSTPLDTFRSLKVWAQSRAKQPSAAQAQNGPGSHVSAWTAVWLICSERNRACWHRGKPPERTQPLPLWPIKFKRRPVRVLGILVCSSPSSTTTK